MKLLTTLFVLLSAAVASAQITIPNTFSPNTVAQSALVNANFSQLGALALNRAGGNLTGNITADGGVTIDGIDIGATICTTCDPTFDDVTVDTLTAVSATFSSTGAAAIDVAGGITAGTGNVAIVDTTGKIPAISSTFFASLSGANLTGILETAIADGSLFARVASAESISGAWTLGNNVSFQGQNNASTALNLATVTSANVVLFGPTDAQVAAGVGVNTALTATGTINLATNQVSRTTIDGTGTLTHGYGLVLSNAISPAALAAGNNNNYNPGTTTYLLRLTPNASDSALTGMSDGVNGRVIKVCDIDGVSANTLTFMHEDANSTAANRFNLGALSFLTVAVVSASTTEIPGPCVEFTYDGTATRWLLTGTTGTGGT